MILPEQDIEPFFLDFQMMSISAAQRARQLTESDLALSMLKLAYWKLFSHGLEGWECDNPACMDIFESLSSPGEEAVHLLDKEYKRQSLLASMTILDTFLSDLLRFLYILRPDLMSKKNADLAAHDMERAVNNSVKEASFGGYGKRLQFVATHFGLDVEELEGYASQIQEFVQLRNAVAHDSALYEYSYDPKLSRMSVRPKTIPEVAYRTSMKASMMVTEIIDAIFVATCQRIFKRDPNVRPLSPAVKSVYSNIRADWEKEDQSRLTPRRILPGWRVLAVENPESGVKYYHISDEERGFYIQPTGIDHVPIMVSYFKNNYHGKMACIKIDDHEPISLESSGLGKSREILGQMLSGKEMSVKYYEWPFEDAKVAHVSLAGFALAWAEADGKTARVTGG